MRHQEGARPERVHDALRGPVPLARAVLVDADEIWRFGLRTLLHQSGLVRVLDEADDAESGVALVGRIQPELVIIDPSLHRDHSRSPRLVRRLVEASPHTQVVLLTQPVPHDVTVELVRLGVQGIVTKGADVESLMRAVRTALGGGFAFDADSTSALVQAVREPPVPADSGFTGREREVLALVVRGLPNRLVGRELFITEATVKFHLRNIMDKLGVRRRAEVVGIALRTGLVDPAPSPVGIHGP